MKTSNNTYILGGLFVLLAVTTACTGSLTTSGDDSMEESIPLRVFASIDGTASTRTVPDVTVYDRSSFKANDVIRLVRTLGGATSSGNYQLTSLVATTQTWTAMSGSTEFMYQSAATYSAFYPVDYNGVLSDQSTVEGFRMSNRLGTDTDVKVAGNALLNLTLKHSNSKVTLKLVGNSDVVFPASHVSFSLKGTGIRTGSAAEESVRPLRLDDAANAWCAILLPASGGNRTIDLTLNLSGTDSEGTYTVTYAGSVTCECVANTHYIYSLVVENDKLILRESGIEGWTDAGDDEGYTGDFNGQSS